MKNNPQHILQSTFGYDHFRGHQEAIIRAVVQGNDAFVLMPTGSGKSICYQIPSMVRKGTGIVISPLIALMHDQVSALKQNGIRAEYLNSSLSAADADGVHARIRSGDTDLLYVAPERLHMERFRRLLDDLDVALFAIDEAHCVSQWGHDFRPEYLRIPEITRSFPGTPKIALTATADEQTRLDIVEKLDLTGAERFISSFDRPNIAYRVTIKNNGNKQLLAFIRDEHPEDSGIVYVRTRKRADDIAAWLRDNGSNAYAYHAGMDAADRMANQNRFLQTDGVIIVATIAFGMGIDKPDVRFVAHLDLPSSMEAYYQETGRAGRDGQPSTAWMAYSLADVVAMRRLLEASDGSADFKRIQQRKLESLLGYCETVSCRRQVLLSYFGESYNSACKNCDTCHQKVEAYDGTVAAQKALSCVYRTGQRFGAAHLTDVLMGNPTERVLQFGHDRIKTFGVGNEFSQAEWRSIFRQLLAEGFLSVDLSKISGFRLTPTSWPVLKGERQVHLRKDPAKPSGRKKQRTKTAPDAELATEDERKLWEKLRTLRMQISKDLGIPPYVVFHDKTLTEMVRFMPKSRSELMKIGGIGQTKADRFGAAFLDAINNHAG